MNDDNKKVTQSLLILVAVVVGIYLLTINMNNNSMMMDEEHHEDEMMEEHEIYPRDVANKIKNDEDIILLDVRTLEEYEEIHLKNALLLPVQELSAKSLSDIGLGENAKNKEIIIYCRSGGRSKTAYDIMDTLGYTNIKSVAGGMIHWEEDQYPFAESGAYSGHINIDMDSDEESDKSGPKVVFDRTLHKFGEIPQYGGTVDAEFIVKNEGSETLVIGDITTSCSCTSASISGSEIESGESAVLTVTFDPDFHEEPLDSFKRTVFIKTNDTNTPEAEVAIEVDIAEGK